MTGCGRCASFAGIGWIGATSSRSILLNSSGVMLASVLVPMARFVATFGYGLVGSTKQRPPQPETSLLFGTHHRTDQAPYLRYGGWDHLWIET